MRLKQLAFHWCIMSYIIKPFITVGSFHYILILHEFTESTFSFSNYLIFINLYLQIKLFSYITCGKTKHYCEGYGHMINSPERKT